MPQFPCPRCGGVIHHVGARCPSCGTPPHPAWGQWSRLHERLADLDRQDLALRRTYAELAGKRHALQRQITELQAQLAPPLIRTAAPTETPGGPAQAPPGPPSPAGPPAPAAQVRPVIPAPQPTAAPARRPETSTRSVQTILLILGGVLLAVAAIVFTAVAWATFGIVGRAVILAGITLVAFAVPVLLRRRELTATAETVASLALLLTLLDGYAAWTVNLFGVRDLQPSGYAALVFAVTAVLAAGYRPVSRLAVPWYAALLCAQPVLPLVVQTVDPDPLSHSVGFAVTAAGNLAVAAWLRRVKAHWALPQVAFILFLLTAGLAGALSALKLGRADNVPDAVLAGSVLVATTGLGVAAASGKQPPARALAAAVATVAVIAAVARPVAIAIPGYGLLIATATTVAVWAAAWRLPTGWRPGVAYTAAVTGGALAVPAALQAVVAAMFALTTATPLWRGDPGQWTAIVTDANVDWEPLAVLGLLAGAATWLTGRHRKTGRHVAAVALVGLIGLAAPVALMLPWWSPEVVGTSLGLALAVTAALARDETAAAARGITSAAVLLHTIGVSLIRPGVTAGVLAAVAAGSGLVALVAARTDRQRLVGGAATGLAVALLPGIVGSAGVALHWPDAAVIPAMTAASGVGLGIAAGLRFLGSGYLGYAVAGLAVATATPTLAVLSTGQPTGVYAAASGLIGLTAGALLPRNRAVPVGTGALPLAVALVSVLPGALSPAQAYLWLLRPWQGSGDTTRELLAPEPAWFADAWDPLTLVLLSAGLAVAGYRLARRPDQPAQPDQPARPTQPARAMLPAAVPGAVVTLLVLPVSYDWPWPSLPVIALALAVGVGLAAGLTRRTLPAGVWLTWPVAGSLGLAACLALRVATLAGLATATLAGLVVGLRGRDTRARVTGWLVAGPAAAGLAHVAGLHAGLSDQPRAYLALGVAVVLLAAAAVLPKDQTAEKRTTEWLSLATAGSAVLVGWPALSTVAAIFAGYGALLGLSALRPGRHRLVYLAIGCELVAWWLFLWSRDVGVVEAYTVPFALGALIGGVLELRRRPELDSWRAYGVALAALFVPSLAVIVSGDDPPLRRLGIGVVALAAVLVGAVGRWRAPVVAGGASLLLLALREAVDLVDVLPRWVPLAAAGVILLFLGATYEQRRRDLRRLRDAYGRWS